MLLCIDIGNTNVVLGVASGKDILQQWRIRSEKEMTPDELSVIVSNLFASKGISAEDIKNIIISSVVPSLLRTFEIFSQDILKINPLVVGIETKTDMPNLYNKPTEVGIDRIVNAVAAYHKYKKALIIIDFGTATTFDYVTREGAYIGGAISPGLMISSEALHAKTARLPKLEMFVVPKSAIGRDTISSMQVGLVFGYVGLVDGIVSRMIKESGESEILVIATGGLALMISDVSDTIDHLEPLLTLEGLLRIFEINS